MSFLFAADANVFVAASAGNAGPGATTVGSPASAPWVTAVGANTHDRTFRGGVTLGNGVTYHGASVTRGLASTPLVDGKAAGSIGCDAGALNPAVVSGKVVLCEGSRLRAARGQAVLAAGGVGMVLYSANSPEMQFSDNHYLPAVHLRHEDGLAVRAYITGQGASATAATVVDDPASDINVALVTGVGIKEHVIPVAAGTEHLRASLFDEATDGEDDLDLYLFDPAGNFVDGSGSTTSTEQVDASKPVPGNWKVLVHGWQTDGPDAVYTRFSWQVPGTAAGNLAVAAPTTATLGQQGTIDVTWSGPTAGTRYLGGVRYSNATSEVDRTLLAVNA